MNTVIKTEIAVMGGTFDPIHNGHLVTAEAVREQLCLEKVLFIPTGNPPHKSELTLSEHRYNMTRLAIESNRFFEISRIEIDRKGRSYTVDTLELLKKTYSRVMFIIGLDAIDEVLLWKEVERVFELCEFVTVSRPGYDKASVEKKIELYKKQYGGRITLADVPAMDISSTEVRKRVKNNNSIKYFVPETVEKYIYENKLYV